MKDRERYEQVVTEILALAAEAQIRSNAHEPGFVTWSTIADNVYQAVVKGVEGVLAEDDLNRIGLEADTIAIGRIGGFSTEEG